MKMSLGYLTPLKKGRKNLEHYDQEFLSIPISVLVTLQITRIEVSN